MKGDADARAPHWPRLDTPRLLSRSGGLVYHLRALRHARRLWSPFRQAVGDWLQAWSPPRRRLLLIGPSAGYMLCDRFLERFDEIVASEPDPLARLLLRRRLAGRLRSADFDALGGGTPLRVLRAHRADAAVLFCNVLGQVAAPAGQSWRALLAAELGDMHWASFHDVVSTTRSPRRDCTPCRGHGESLERVLANFWPGGELPLTDHDTFDLGAGSPAGYALWSLAPGRHHLIEWVTHAPPWRRA